MSEFAAHHSEELAVFSSWDWTPDSGRLLWSDNLFRIYGCGRRDHSIERLRDRALPSRRQRAFRQAVDELARTGRLPEQRYRYGVARRDSRHLTSTVVSVAASDGLARRMIGTVQDITEQRQAERELAAHFAVSNACPIGWLVVLVRGVWSGIWGRRWSLRSE